MPLGVTLTPRPQVMAVASPPTAALQPQLQTLWQTLLSDLRTALPPQVLQQALAEHDLVAEQLVTATWERVVQTEARFALPLLVRQLLPEVAQDLAPTVARVAGTTRLPLPALANLFDQPAELFIPYVGVDPLPRLRFLIQLQLLAKSRIHQDHRALGVGHNHSRGQ